MAWARLLRREEGSADGGVVVQDCLELLNNLLRNNASNQRMFRCAALRSLVPGPRLFPPLSTCSCPKTLDNPGSAVRLAVRYAQVAVGVYPKTRSYE